MNILLLTTLFFTSVSHLYSTFNDEVYDYLDEPDEYAERKAGIE